MGRASWPAETCRDRIPPGHARAANEPPSSFPASVPNELIGTLTAGTTVLAAAALKAANRISTPQDVILVAATGVLLASVVALVGTRSSVSASPRPAEIGSSP
jgi:hypothetical protein